MQFLATKSGIFSRAAFVRFAPVLRCRYDAASRRCFASISDRTPETVMVPCRSNGEIQLDIYSRNRDALVIFLPSGPLIKDSTNYDQRVITSLVAKSNATIVKLNYRFGPQMRYPVPIHDVLYGFDWIQSEMSTYSIGVCGQLLGGSLGAMLALTESNSGVVAAALNNPIVDWVVPERESLQRTSKLTADITDDYDDGALTKSKRSKRNKAASSSWTRFKDETPLSEEDFIKARELCFSNPSAYFDPFASSIHFFRSPGIDVPVPPKPRTTEDEEEPEGPQLRRKARKIFPPADQEFSLPAVRLTTGKSSCFQSQNEELLDRLATSEINHYLKPQKLTVGKYSSLDQTQQSDIDILKDKVSLKYTLHQLPGSGLWGFDGTNWETDIEQVATWFDRKFNL